MLISDDHRLSIAKCCTLRMQVDHCLIYNSTTDELHIVPLPAAAILKLCDGHQTVGHIADAVTAASGAPPDEARARLDEFAYELVKRGVLLIGAGDAT